MESRLRAIADLFLQNPFVQRQDEHIMDVEALTGVRQHSHEVA